MLFRPLILGFWLAAAAASAATTQAVTVSFNTLESELSGDINNTTDTADMLLGGGTIAPTYWKWNDVDYYRLDVATTPATLFVLVEGTASVVIQGDPEIWLEDGHGSILAHHDDIAPIYNLNCSIRYEFKSPGDYYVRVEHAAKSQWYYNYSNYTISGEYERIVEKPAAVRRNRWELYR